jgi:1-acyl-sn-glycerol-3-phosphate acyltransferase
MIMVLFGTPKKKAGASMRRSWLRYVPSNVGMQMRLEGKPYKGTCLYISNHIGYIDPFVILVHVDANVVAKAEILSWPLIGYGGYIAGTIYVKREKKSSRLQTALAIRAALEEGTSILIFPEGTTSAGPTTLPFRTRAFDTAYQAGVPIQPIAILYESPLVAFIGADTFLPHFFKLFRLKSIKGRVAFGPLIRGENAAIETQQWIDEIQLKDSFQTNP